MKLPLARTLTAEDLDPASLPVLLALLRHGSRQGILELRMEGMDALRVRLADGMLFMNGGEHKNLLDAFRVESGTYALEVKPVRQESQRTPYPVSSLVVDGMKNLLRRLDVDEMTEALGERLDLAPFVGSRQARLIAKLPLVPVETRLVKYSFCGQESARSLLEHLGMRKHTSVSLMMMLSVYNLLEWRPAPETKTATIADVLDKRVRDLSHANHFQILGLHWSAIDEEVSAAFEKMAHELAPGQPAYDAAPQACDRLMSLATKAHTMLKNEAQRVRYRKKAFPGLDAEALSDFLDKKAKAWALRDDGISEASKARRRRRGFGDKN